jgi:hypothetical protein
MDCLELDPYGGGGHGSEKGEIIKQGAKTTTPKTLAEEDVGRSGEYRNKFRFSALQLSE